MSSNIQMESSWKKILASEFEKDYMKQLRLFLASEYEMGKTIFPPKKDYFSAFNLVPFDRVKVVILGQDPYHGEGQSHGLCFSVRPGVRVPPSLVNIYKELKSDLDTSTPQHGCLVSWANQGVLLLNSVLTVVKSSPGSHRGKGWEKFTDEIVKLLSQKRSGIVFMLWGAYAQKKGEIIDSSKHLILKAAHPSPFSAHRFLGCKHFSKANEFFKKNGKTEINWEIL